MSDHLCAADRFGVECHLEIHEFVPQYPYKYICLECSNLEANVHHVQYLRRRDARGR